MQSGLVFNIQKYSVNDGPGIRTTVFLKGCPLCCSWCHNPESISPRREILLVESRCIGCEECREACEMKKEGSGALSVKEIACQLCAKCVDACPSGARQMVGAKMPVTEVMKVLLQDRVFYEQSGGGVTFSGGEPLMQPVFLRALLSACRTEGIHAAVDTCGYADPQHLMAVAPLTDLFLFDLKLIDSREHKKFCGVPNEPILENLKNLAQMHPSVWIRVPVIPGVNDSRENMEGIARLVSSLNGVHPVNLLPYHKTGVTKAKRLGRAENIEAYPSPTADDMKRVAEIFKAAGLEVKYGG